MNEALADILGQSQTYLITAFVVFLRIGAAVSVLPAFGEQSVPARIRLVLAILFTIIVTPAVDVTITENLAGAKIVGAYFATEAIVGLAIGIGLRLFVFALQMAGSIAAQSTSLSQIFGAAGVDPQPAIGHIMVVSGLAVAVSLGLHVQFARLFIQSYDVFTPGQFPDGQLLSNWGVGQIARAFGLAFTLAAPFVIASLIYNIALGVINRAMPQLMVAFVGAPAITAGGLLLMFVSLPILLSIWMAAFQGYMLDPFGGGG